MGHGPAAAADLLVRAVGAQTLPGAVLAAGWGPDVEVLHACGWAETRPSRRPMTPGTVFDLASLTKVTGTLPIVLRLVSDGSVSLTTPVGEVLPGWGRESPAAGRVTVEHLLTHTSGLPPYREYWREGLSPADLRRRLESEPLEAEPGTRVCYSDIGFLLLGWVAEAVTGRSLGELFAAWVAEPLAMSETGYGPRPGADVAATEPREGGAALVGTVHDETAAALGSPAGHAGLFAPAADLAAYLAAWADPSDRWLPARLRRQAASDRTAALGGHRGLGWAARHDGHDQLGDGWPGTAVFHSGFTGTSLALDIPSGRWVVLLTNDVHFGRRRADINPLRQAVHTALAP